MTIRAAAAKWAAMPTWCRTMVLQDCKGPAKAEAFWAKNASPGEHAKNAVALARSWRAAIALLRAAQEKRARKATKRRKERQ